MEQALASCSLNYWVAVKEPNSSYYLGEGTFFYNHYGNLTSITATQIMESPRLGTKTVGNLQRKVSGPWRVVE